MDAAELHEEVKELTIRLVSGYFTGEPTAGDILMIENAVLHGVLLGQDREMAAVSLKMASPRVPAGDPL